jgi:hypothetical protein
MQVAKWKRLAKNRKPFHLEAPGIEPATTTPQGKSRQDVTETLPFPLARALAHESQIDADLGRLIDAWPTLPATAKRMILAALEASGPPR